MNTRNNLSATYPSSSLPVQVMKDDFYFVFTRYFTCNQFEKMVTYDLGNAVITYKIIFSYNERIDAAKEGLSHENRTIKSR